MSARSAVRWWPRWASDLISLCGMAPSASQRKTREPHGRLRLSVAPIQRRASTFDERETCGRVGEIEESLDGRRSRDEAESEAVGPRVCIPLEDHSQPGRVEETHRAEIERHLLEAGPRQLAQVSRHLGNRRQIDLAFGAYANPLPFEFEFAAER